MGWTKNTVVKVAKRTGYPVVEAWSGRNAGQMGTVYGPMLHHTGSGNSSGADYPTLRVVRDGRAGLENSLSMYGIGKSGTIYCISEKISWHAGAGNWKGVTDGNGHFAGIEAESSGNGKDWTPAQLDAYKKLVASILIETGRDASWAPAHREWALPRGRKPDPAGIDVVAFRAEVQKMIDNPSLLGVVEGGEEDLANALDTPIHFVNPDTGKLTTFTLAAHIAWTNYYVSKLFTAMGQPQPPAPAVDPELVRATVKQAVEEALAGKAEAKADEIVEGIVGRLANG